MVEVVRLLRNFEGQPSRICRWSQCRPYEDSIIHFGHHPAEPPFTLTYMTLPTQGVLPAPVSHFRNLPAWVKLPVEIHNP